MKRYVVSFSEHALKDIELAASYYNEQQTGLGKRFIKEVQNSLKLIRNNPYYSGVRYVDIRCAVVKKFPFLIHYTFSSETRSIQILAVFNTHKKPLW